MMNSSEILLQSAIPPVVRHQTNFVAFETANDNIFLAMKDVLMVVP